jgi:hypothetical protein
MEYGRNMEESIEDKNMNETEIYMRGRKISEIVHMFTQPNIRLEGGRQR